MKSAEAIETITIYDAEGKPRQRPRNWLYEQIAAKQAEMRSPGYKPPTWGEPIAIKGESLSHTLIRERRGEFD